MMGTEAKPDRYVVDRHGTPDPPGAAYYVLDVVHDHFAREVLWMLVRKYRNGTKLTSVRADELEQLLKETDEATRRYYESLNAPAKGKVGRPKSARPKS